MPNSFHSLALAGLIGWMVALSLGVVGYLFRLQLRELRLQRRLKVKQRQLELNARLRRHWGIGGPRTAQWEPGAWLLLGDRMDLIHEKTLRTVQNMDSWDSSQDTEFDLVCRMQNPAGRAQAAVNC